MRAELPNRDPPQHRVDAPELWWELVLRERFRYRWLGRPGRGLREQRVYKLPT